MIGQTLSHYRILEKLGAGGMGEVYRAQDTKLGRDVAIKVLSGAFAHDAARLGRFRREALVLASLNHPNIAAIFGLEETDGVQYLVLEHVPGETIAERLAAGPLPLKEALETCRQIAEALEAAHEKGIIHRDLKPANIKVTPDGKVKVLDFGLAKAFEPDSPTSDPSRSPTVTVGGTGDGIILGTAAYMSPEQARAKPLDRRTDIWSFGCVLYETLSGRQAFGEDTISDTFVAILERDPDWRALPTQTPENIRHLVRRCLQKNIPRRVQHIGDARIEIEEALGEPARAPSAPTGAPPAARKWPAAGARLAAVALVSAACAALLTWLVSGPALHLSETTPRLVRVARLTHDPGLSEWPTWSPDGTLLAFAANRTGNFEIYVRRVEGGQEVNVTNDPAEDIQPAFSPDGKWLAFISTRSSRTGMIKIGSTFGFEFRTFGGDLWVAPALGGQARRVAQDANFPVWSPDGGKIAYVSGPEDHRTILEVPAEGGTPKTLLPSVSSNWEIVRLQYSPEGNWVTFDATNPERILIMPSAVGSPRELFAGSNHVWEASGQRIYSVIRDSLGGTRLLSTEMNQASGKVRGASQTVSLMTGILRDLAISRDGQQLAISELEGSLNLTRLPLAPGGGAPAGPEEVLSRGQVIDRYPAFSPDGKRIAFASDRLGLEQIWILNLESKREERLQLPGQDSGSNLPTWTRDGRQVLATRSYPDGTRSLWLAAVDGSRAEELQPPTPGLEQTSISPDGQTVVYAAKINGVEQLLAFDLATRQNRQLTSSPGDKYSSSWSSDGRWIAFTSNPGGFVQVWRMPASGGEAQRMTSGEERIRHVFYSSDGRWLYFQPNHLNIYRMPAAGGPTQRVTHFPESGLFIEEPTLSPDGQSLAYCRSNGGSSLWLLTIARGRSRDH